MDSDHDSYKPAQMAALVESAGVAKARMPLGRMVTLAVLAGVFIGLGGAVRIALGQGHGLQLAVELKRPGVVSAGELARMALGLHHQARAPVAAAVFKRRQAAIGLAHQDDFLGAHVGQDVVTGRGQFALVAHIHPGALKNAFLLQGKHRWVGVDTAVHPMGLHPCAGVPVPVRGCGGAGAQGVRTQHG
jgi:hypothetical protein